VQGLRSPGRGFESHPRICQLSVPFHQRKLGNKQAYHAIHWPCIHGLPAVAGVRLRANETETSAALWTYEAPVGL